MINPLIYWLWRADISAKTMGFGNPNPHGKELKGIFQHYL